MHPLLTLSVLWFLPLASMLEEDSPLNRIPRKFVPYHRDNARLFSDAGVKNYSTMLVREDMGLLVLGARGVVYALDLNDISNKKASVIWSVSDKQTNECKHKGKDPEIECKNYIRILHTMEDGRMYVCGTNAFDPECDYMSYADGKLTLENKIEDGKGKCPFDPFQRYSYLVDGDDLYSATSLNFLGSEPVVMRSPASIRTEFKSSWLNEPNFISMAQMPESQSSVDGDDDKVYLFFSETAVEYDFYSKVVVSRVARVCKGDLGGQRTLQKKWTSFLKARVECPVLESQLPYIIQDSYLWCDDAREDWKSCLFFAIFTPPSDTSDLSAVCAYSVADISRVFSEGKYKTPVTVETSFVKWVMYSGEVPSPRPGACIDNEARKQDITETLDLPDRTLQFVRDRPLMDQVVQPLGRKPLLVRRGAAFTRIIANQVQAVDGERYHVMFIGTEEGTMLKAVNYDGEMFIIEEVEVFQGSESSEGAIKVLRFSNATGQLYAGSDCGAVQMPLASCGRSLTCVDCVLARDPYCGWDTAAAKCTALSDAPRDLIQSVRRGDASLCPEADPVKPVNRSLWLGGNLKLQCPPSSNLAETSWERDGRPLPLLPSSPRLQRLRDGLLILNATSADVGRYRCVSRERSHAGQYAAVVADYRLVVGGSSGRGLLPSPPQARRDGPSVPGLQAAVGLLAVLLSALLGWNFYKGHLPLPCWTRGGKSGAERAQDPDVSGRPGPSVTHQEAPGPGSAESKPLVSGAGNRGTSNNNHSGGELRADEEEEEDDSSKAALPPLQYIDDESAI